MCCRPTPRWKCPHWPSRAQNGWSAVSVYEPATAEAILDEPVQESWSLDSQYGYCTYASVAKSDSRWSADLLPTYGPLGKHQYVAATVWPVGDATDPFMYVAYAILDRSHGRLSAFIEQQGMHALEDLARVESSVKQLSRQYLPDLGEGALWYWQETSTGHHLAGIYALWQNQRVAVQALVAPGRSEEAVLAAMRQAVEELIVANARSAAPAPLIVDSCPNFTAFDAAAILQEPVNAEEPIGNLLFGPLPAWAAEEGFDQVVDGLCGYTNAAADRILSDSAALPLIKQTHLATPLDADHAVAASHVIGGLSDSTSVAFSSDWFDLMLLVYVVGAANPQLADASVHELYGALTTGDFPDVLALLYRNAQADPSFKATKISPAEGHAHDELLWLWQTVDDGYFSLLIGRQGTDFDLVAARLGNWVTEKTVLGYSQVVMEKMADAAAASRSGTQLVAGCDRLALATVAAIVGEPVQGHPVASEQGAGCKYTPVADDLTVDSADFSGQFQTFGLLSGVIRPQGGAAVALWPGGRAFRRRASHRWRCPW